MMIFLGILAVLLFGGMMVEEKSENKATLYTYALMIDIAAMVILTIMK